MFFEISIGSRFLSSFPRKRQVPGVQDFAPAGERGWGNRIACRYWGLTPQEYYDAADLWPLDPEGNILLMGISGYSRGKEIGRQQGSRRAALRLLTQRGRRCSWRCLHPQSSANVRRRPGLQAASLS
jgi:hypothetical protein